MRYKLICLFLLLGFGANAQYLHMLERADSSSRKVVVTNNSGIQRYVEVDSLATLLGVNGSVDSLAIIQDTILVYFRSGSELGRDTIGTYNRNQIDSKDALRVLYTDTAAMLSPYITEVEVNDTLSAYYLSSQVDSADALRVLYTDTPAMLLPYITELEVRDTLNSYYLSTQVDSAHALRVLYTDTAAMLSSYITTLEARSEINDTANVLRSEIGGKTDTTDFNALELTYNPNSQPILNKHYRAVDQQTIYIEEINNAAQGVSRLLNTTLSSGRNAYQDAEVVWVADNSDSTVTYSNKGADFTLTRVDSTYSINNEGEIYIWYKDFANIDFSDNKQKAGLLLRDEERIQLGNYFVYPVVNAPSQEIEIDFIGATEGTIYWGDGDVTTGYTSGTSVTHNYSPNFTGLIKIEFDADVTVTEIGGLSPSYSNENIGDLPASLTLYQNQGLNTTSGNIGQLPSGLTFYRTQGFNTTSGDIGQLPSVLIFYRNQGSNTTSGDIGQLPSGLTYYFNTGSNTTSGDIGQLPSGLIFYQNTGSNTTSGDIGQLPSSLTLYLNLGSNTTSGDIGQLPSSLTYYRNEGSNTVSDYTSKVWSANMNYFKSLPTSGSGLSTSEVDQLLIDFAATTWTASRFIDISGNNAARSSASDAAVTSLTSAGVTVITN